MNTINKMKNLYKARFGTFTDEEFDALCKTYDNVGGLFDTRKKNDAEAVLKVFFAHRTPSPEQLMYVYGYGDSLRWLYLSNLSKKRMLTDKEQKYMVEYMNFGPVFRFPHQLSEDAVERLFAVGNINRIVTYVRDFVLPERFELELIRRYARQKINSEPETWFKKGYGCALSWYLEAQVCGKCTSAKVQDMLLEVADDELWAKLCSTQSLTENVLKNNTVRVLISKNYVSAVRALLIHSFIQTSELQRYLRTMMPQLKWELEISKVRHVLRKMELQDGTFWGVEAPTFHEMKIIDVSVLNDDKDDFAEYSIRPRFKSGAATPYFCAWATDWYPKLGEEAYACLRTFAESKKNELKRN